MKGQIRALKVLFDSGVNKKMFFDLMLNITNGAYTEGKPAYANYLKIETWKELYGNKYLGLNVSEDQIVMFLNYMAKYANQYVNKEQDYYVVYKSFIDNSLRKEENFQFESIVFEVFDTI